MSGFRPLRSSLSVAVGYLLMAFLVGISHLALQAIAPGGFHLEEARIDAPWLQILWGLGAVSAVFGGWTTARLAPGSELAHAVVLAGVVLGAWVFYAAFVPVDQSTSTPPMHLLSGIVGVLAGGVLRQLQVARHSERS